MGGEARITNEAKPARPPEGTWSLLAGIMLLASGHFEDKDCISLTCTLGSPDRLGGAFSCARLLKRGAAAL